MAGCFNSLFGCAGVHGEGFEIKLNREREREIENSWMGIICCSWESARARLASRQVSTKRYELANVGQCGYPRMEMAVWYTLRCILIGQSPIAVVHLMGCNRFVFILQNQEIAPRYNDHHNFVHHTYIHAIHRKTQRNSLVWSGVWSTKLTPTCNK